MKRVFLIVLAVVFWMNFTKAQKIKTGVVVVGNGNSATAAAIQSAVSGAKTTLILTAQDFEVSASNGKQLSGIEAELLKRIAGNDNPALVDYGKVKPVIVGWTDTLKNLSVIKDTGIQKLKRSGSGWNIMLTSGSTVKADVMVNADETGKISGALQLQDSPLVWNAFNYNDFLYRTSVASGFTPQKDSANVLIFSRFLKPDQENLISLNNASQSFAAGQAAGAIAAYAAFFKTKTSQANMKIIQGELLKYKVMLVPFADVATTDSLFDAIQKIGLSGFLKGEISNGNLYFRPGQEVLTREIKEPIKSFYYKAQIWFDDYEGEKMTLGSTLEMIAYVGGYSIDNITREVKKNWKKGYNFDTEFDLNQVVTRREFAALSQYLKHFNVGLDKTGKAVR